MPVTKPTFQIRTEGQPNTGQFRTEYRAFPSLNYYPVTFFVPYSQV